MPIGTRRCRELTSRRRDQAISRPMPLTSRPCEIGGMMPPTSAPYRERKEVEGLE